MADYFQAAGSLVGGVTDFFAGNAEAKGAKAAAGYYTQAAQITEQETGIKAIQQGRQLYQVQGAAEAQIGASGLASSGSAADILRSNAQQGSMDKSLIEQQGRIQEQAYLGQAASANAEAKAAKSKGKGGLLGGIVKAGAAIATGGASLAVTGI